MSQSLGQLPEDGQVHEIQYLSGIPSRFFVEIVKNRPLLDELQFKLEKTMHKKKNNFKIGPKQEVKEHSLVAVQFCDDVNESYVRGQICDVLDEDIFIVTFIDYGAQEVVEREKLYRLPDELSWQMPFSLICSVSNWSEGKDELEEQNNFKSWFQHKRVEARFISRDMLEQGPLFHVELQASSGSLSENIIDFDDAASIAPVSDEDDIKVKEWLSEEQRKTNPVNVFFNSQEPALLNFNVIPVLKIEEKIINRLTPVKVFFPQEPSSPDNFYIILHDRVKDYGVLLTQMEKDFEGLPGELSIDDLFPGALLQVRDKDGVFRGECLRCEESAGKVKVWLFDEGIEKTFFLKDCKPLARNQAKLPKMSFRCRINDIKPLKNAKSFCDKARSELRRHCKALGSKHIFIFDQTEEELKVDFLIEKDVLMSLRLCEMKLAKLIDDSKLAKQNEEHKWNPMKDEYYGEENFYQDPRKMKEETEERRICRFFRDTRKCRRGDKCRFLHVYTGSGYDSFSRTKTVLTVAFHDIRIPDEGSLVHVQIPHIRNPNSFFLTMPNGSIDLTLPEDQRNLLEEKFKSDENLESLLKAMKDHYTAFVLRSQRVTYLCSGLIVAAKSVEDNCWYRARVIDPYTDWDGQGSVLVNYVDFGHYEMIPSANIREIEHKFLHLPFQAFECSLHGIESNCEDFKWSEKAVQRFYDLSMENFILAKIRNKKSVERKVEVDLFILTDQMINIGELLVREGLARHYEVRKHSSSLKMIPG